MKEYVITISILMSVFAIANSVCMFYNIKKKPDALTGNLIGFFLFFILSVWGWLTLYQS